MKKLLILPLLSVMLLASCGDTNEEAMPQNSDTTHSARKESGYVPGYFSESDNAQIIEGGSPIQMYYEPDTLKVSFWSPSQGFIYSSFFLVTRKSAEEGMPKVYWMSESERFEQYAEYYGDTTYSARRTIGRDYEVSAMPLNSISITADRDFDAEHPAGSLLNDLFVLEYTSAYNLIKSGYAAELDKTQHKREMDAYQQMPLSDFEPINLLDCGSSLNFTKLPDALGEYTFTITLEYGADPVSGRVAKKIAPAVVKAVFTEADYVTQPTQVIVGE